MAQKVILTNSESKGTPLDPQQLAAILTACMERGFAPPLYVCAVSVNGAVIAVRYTPAPEEDDRVECTVLAEHLADPGFLLPINLLITDAQGNAVRAVLPHPDSWHFADLN